MYLLIHTHIYNKYKNNNIYAVEKNTNKRLYTRSFEIITIICMNLLNMYIYILITIIYVLIDTHTYIIKIKIIFILR